MNWLKADKALDFTVETENTAQLFRQMAQRSYRHQRRVIKGLDREQARKLVTDRQIEIYQRLTDLAVGRLGRILPAFLRQLRNGLH